MAKSVQTAQRQDCFTVFCLLHQKHCYSVLNELPKAARPQIIHQKQFLRNTATHNHVDN